MTPQPKRSETAPSMESPEEPAPVREFAGIPVLESTIRGDAVLSGPVSVAGPGRLTRRGDTRPLGAHLEDEKKASLHNPEPERESPATPGGDLRIENGGTPAGTFSSHDALDEGNLRGESPDSARVREGSPPQVTAADHLSFSSSYYLAYRDLIQLPEWKLDRPTYEIVKAQVRGDARLSRQERTDLLERLSCPYCGYSDLHHGPSRDCTGRE